MDTEERKTRRFEQGLKPWIYNKVAVLQLETFSQILEKAIITEGGSEALHKHNQERKQNKGRDNGGHNKGESSMFVNRNPKRKWEGGNSYSMTNKGGGNTFNSKPHEEHKNKVKRCQTYGKGHTRI